MASSNFRKPGNRTESQLTEPTVNRTALNRSLQFTTVNRTELNRHRQFSSPTSTQVRHEININWTTKLLTLNPLRAI